MDPDRPVVRWTLIVVWALIGCLLYAPVAGIFGWPLMAVAVAGGIVWTRQDFISLRHQTEEIPVQRISTRLQLALICGLAGVCSWLATAVSMREHGHTYGLSDGVAPLLLAIVLVASLAALQRPTPRRLATTSLVVLGVAPILAAIRVFAIPLFGADFELIAPRVLDFYAVAVLAIAGLGIHLGIVARRFGYGDEILPPPPVAHLRR